MERSKLNFDSSWKKTSFIRIGKRLPTSDRNASFQLCNKVKAPIVRTFEFTRILLSPFLIAYQIQLIKKMKIHCILKRNFHLTIVLN